MILAPAPASDPNADSLLVSDRVVVRCIVNHGGAPESRPVDAESVAIVRLDGTGMVADSPAVTSTGSEFQASFNLGALPNGRVAFRCTAADTNEEPLCGRGEVQTLLDLGPRIEVLTPPDLSIHSERMTLRYRVTPSPLDATDSEADVVDHRLVVAGVTITSASEVGDGELQADIDFTDRSVFVEPLAGEFELVLTATNMRTPVAATRRTVQSFTIDSEGPVVVFSTPTEAALVGGRVRVEATITDPAGVDESTAILRVGTTELAMRRVMGDRFEVFFDAAAFPSTVAEVTLNVTAADIVGNRSTVSRVVKLDTVPPIASLDPPEVREGRVRAMGLECSTLFDPVGSDSVDDGEVVGTAAEFRARTHDLGNSSFGGSGTVTFLAGMRSAKLYLLDDSSVALLVDQNGDGVCDAINPAVEPIPGDPSTAVVVDLVPVAARGQSLFPTAITEDVTVSGTPASAYGSAFASCINATTTTTPAALCPESTPMTRVIPAPLAGNPPAIYVRAPITTSTCVGDAFDFQSALSEGWACVAVRSEDNLGNVGVSPPMRTCFVDGVGSDPCPGPLGTIVPEVDRPSCTDGCTLPLSYRDIPALQLVVPD
jgi:hypothetical protein